MLRIFLLDNYDSFTYNLWDYLLRQGGVEVVVQRNDRCDKAALLAGAFDGLVLSPGPQRPENAGALMDIVADLHDKMPILGVCLGHQAIGTFFGARLVRAVEPMHGKTSPLTHNGQGLFAGLPNPMPVMRYHSLVLEGVGGVLEEVGRGGGVCMAIRHKTLPLWGVQFHPESILTPDGMALLSNWTQMLKDIKKTK